MNPKLEATLLDNGYYHLVEIQGKICGLHDYMFTCGLVIGLDFISYERRYCFPSRDDAIKAVQEYADPTRHPKGPWIKCKGVFQGRSVDLLNPEIHD